VSKKTQREARQVRRKRKKIISTLIWGGLGIALAAVLGFIIWTAVRPAAGEDVPVMANAGDHVAEGQDPGPFNSDPPTSGRHYGNEYEAGFYEESDSEAQFEYPEGFLIHNLEHGYAIFWYNCNLLDDSGCSELKNQIKSVIDEFNGVKVIGFPRATIDSPVVATTWGRMQRFNTFDENLAVNFVRSNRGRAPEPNAP
jgi:hypothetical protein